MSDATDKVRRLNNESIRYVPPRRVIEAMLDVIEAAGHVCAERDYTDDYVHRMADLRHALARFREVADE